MKKMLWVCFAVEKIQRMEEGKSGQNVWCVKCEPVWIVVGTKQQTTFVIFVKIKAIFQIMSWFVDDPVLFTH